MTAPWLDAVVSAAGWRLADYLSAGGYAASKRVLETMSPAAVREEVRKASLRGRGGAGFPAGVKWGFVPQDDAGPRYLCVNADEGEPGTFKDRHIMTRAPHLLLEGIIIASYAVGARAAFIYIRGEYEMIARRLEAAVTEAQAAGLFEGRIDILVHRGAGAYVCGEETALLESLEGKRGWPRLKPPFPATVGLFRRPTVIQNVETLANLPRLVAGGAEAFLALGRPKDGGTRLFGVSGAVVSPGLYERPVGTSLRKLIYEAAGGLPSGRGLKAVIPGGLSSPLLLPDEIDVAMDFDSLAASGSMLGSAGVIVIADDTPIVKVLDRMATFYAHESCGQCTPCRLGTSWLARLAARMAAGDARPGDASEIERVAGMIKGRTLCPLGDAAALPIRALVGKFRSELEAAEAAR